MARKCGLNNSESRAVKIWIRPVFFRLECVALPFYERHITLPRTDVSPVWTRSWPIAKEPTTLGQHLKKKRFQAGLRQAQIARILRVSCRTLSLWECDRIYPAWAFQPRIIAYLGYDPFTETGLKNTRGNEPSGVAFLSPDAPVSIGQKIRHFRLKSRKTRLQFAKEWGISPKTLWGWETGLREPSPLLKKRIGGKFRRAGSFSQVGRSGTMGLAGWSCQMSAKYTINAPNVVQK